MGARLEVSKLSLRSLSTRTTCALQHFQRRNRTTTCPRQLHYCRRPLVLARPVASLTRCSASSSSSSSSAAAFSSDNKPDGIIVLAGGLTPTGGVPTWVEGRLDAALALHRKTGSIILCTGGGTPHKPPILFENGHINHESTVCANYLLERGVQSDKILKEWSSFDTIGNAYFSLVVHALPLQWKRVVAITSDFHMPRTKVAFDWIYGRGDSSICVDYVGVPDQGMSEEALKARMERERESAVALRKSASKLTSLVEINQWLHATHRCYAVSRQDEWSKPTEADDLALKTY